MDDRDLHLLYLGASTRSFELGDSDSMSFPMEPSSDYSPTYESLTDSPERLDGDSSPSYTLAPSDLHLPSGLGSGPSQPISDPSDEEPSKGSEQVDDSRSYDKGTRSRPFPDAKTRKKMQPDRAIIFERVWGWALSIAGLQRTKHEINLTDTPTRQLSRELQNEESAIQDIQSLADVHLLQIRWRLVLLAEEYKKLVVSESRHLIQPCEQSQDGTAEESPGHQITRRQIERILDDMTRDLYGLGPDDCIHPRDPRRHKVKRWLRIGQLLLAMITEMGWAALLIPAILLNQDDLARVKPERINDFVEYVKDCYLDWEQELREISPMIQTLLYQGVPHGLLLRIHALPSGSLPVNMDCSFSYWLSYMPYPGNSTLTLPELRPPRNKTDHEEAATQ